MQIGEYTRLVGYNTELAEREQSAVATSLTIERLPALGSPWKEADERRTVAAQAEPVDTLIPPQYVEQFIVESLGVAVTSGHYLGHASEVLRLCVGSNEELL